LKHLLIDTIFNTNKKIRLRMGDQDSQDILDKKENKAEDQAEETKSPMDELQDKYDALLRAYAEKENEIKRIKQDSESEVRYQKSKMARDFLDISENLNRALDAIKSEYTKHADDTEIQSTLKNVMTGIEMTEQAFLKSLDKNGIKKIKTIGENMDPNLHQAIQQIPSDKAPGTIIDEVQSGYMIGDKVLREAMVVVAKENEADANSKSGAGGAKAD
jgi:molecular chaperone GrpE